MNHVPAFGAYKNTTLGLSHYKGPAFFMGQEDHRLTASWGRRRTASQWRELQEQLIRKNKFGKALEMDIRDVQRKFGGKYNDAMLEMIEYARREALITNKEAKRLTRKYFH